LISSKTVSSDAILPTLPNIAERQKERFAESVEHSGTGKRDTEIPQFNNPRDTFSRQTDNIHCHFIARVSHETTLVRYS